MLTPNIWFHEDFGKVLFCICDLIVGIILYRMNIQINNETNMMASICSSFWLLNPMVIGVSTRGNCETIINLLVLNVFLYNNNNNNNNNNGFHNTIIASLWFGFAIHMKIYPIIYALPLFLSKSTIRNNNNNNNLSIFSKLFSINGEQAVAIFVTVSVLVCMYICI